MKFLYFSMSLLFLSQCQQDDPLHTALLYGSSDLGYYYVNIYVGNPPQKQSLIIDTASSITTFPCTQCEHCGKHENHPFDIQKSNTATTVGCNTVIGLKKCDRCDKSGHCIFSISYAEGSSLAGFYLQDQVLFGDELIDQYGQNATKDIINDLQVQTVFGCTTSETNLFYTQLANGIMGLSPKTNTTFTFPNLVDQIYEKEINMSISNSFAICIGRLNGYMSIGSYDKSRHQQDSIYQIIPYYRSSPNEVYGIKVQNVKINNQTIIPQGYAQKGQGTFIDSGSTLLNAHEEIANQFQSTFDCDKSLSQCTASQMIDGLKCFQLDQQIHDNFEQFANLFPTFVFELEKGFLFPWTPLDYLTKDLNNPNMYCLPVFSYSSSPQRMILGQVWMRNWDIAFDKGKEELTFVRSNCSNNQVHHNFTEEEIAQLEQNQNVTKQTYRYTPPDHKNELWKELVKLGVCLVVAALLLTIFWYIRRRKLMKRGSKQTLSDLEQAEEQHSIGIKKTVDQ